jgi:uncharacterized protein CbrC (UPF0167 family)
VTEGPEFRYHPDPLATGSVERAEAKCDACGQLRHLVYVGPVYAEEGEPTLCPWCIADGTAAEAFGAEFTSVGPEAPEDIHEDALLRLTQRTPGFTGWQQEHWLYHCGDAAAFLGLAGREELEAHPGALESLISELAELNWSNDEVDDYLSALSTTSSPTAYLFRCLSCETHLAYSDSD